MFLAVLIVRVAVLLQQAVQHCYWQVLNPAAAAVAERRVQGFQAEVAEAPRTEAKAAKTPRTKAPPICFLSWSFYERTPCTTCLTNMPSNPLEESHSA